MKSKLHCYRQNTMFHLSIYLFFPSLLFSLIFQPSKVLAEIADCVEASVKEDLVFQVNSSKPHGSGTDYIKAIKKTADSTARFKNMTTEDFEYANKHLPVKMMETFRYKHPSEVEL